MKRFHTADCRDNTNWDLMTAVNFLEIFVCRRQIVSWRKFEGMGG